MKELEITITNKTGLHARPAAKFVQIATKFTSKVKISVNNKVTDGKSILALMGLRVKQNTKITLIAEGQDEDACLRALQELIVNNFGEE